jgi:PAS domain S-box-containing protein
MVELTSWAASLGFPLGAFLIGVLLGARYFPRSTGSPLLRSHEEALQRTLADRLAASSALIAGTEVRFRTLVEGSPHWISLLTTEGIILSINPAGLSLLNQPEQDLLGKPLADLLEAATHGGNGFHCGDLPKDRVTAFEARIKASQPTRPRYVRGSLKPLPRLDGNVDQLAGIFTDITDQLAADLALHEANELLEERVRQRTEDLALVNQQLIAARDVADAANQAKSDFLANVSHEIRTPMNAILGFTSLLLTTPLSERQKEYAETVQRSGNLLLKLLDDILDLSKIEAGMLSLDVKPFSPRDCLREVADLFSPKAAEKGLRLDLKLPPLPDFLLGDQLRLRQIISNLVGNAIKFTQTGSVTIDTTCQRSEGSEACTLHIRIIDTGIGIPLDKRHRLFKKFSQAETSTTRRFGGTGLGLAICRELVESMNGTITFASEEKAGSTFSIAIPFLIALGTLGEGPGPSRPTPELPALPTGVKILVVEDQSDSQRLLSDLLEKHGSVVIVAGTGAEALELLEKRLYDVILMDVALPGQDGLATTREIRRREGPHRHTPIIAVTAAAMANDRQLCLDAGMDGYLAKPVSEDHLIWAIAAALAQVPSG